MRVEVDGRTLTLVNLEKVMYPRTGTTKGEVLHYYAQVAPRILPVLADRPRHQRLERRQCDPANRRERRQRERHPALG